MQTTQQSPSKTRIALTWLLLVSSICFWIFFCFARIHHPANNSGNEPIVVHSIVSMIAGVFFTVVGVGGYLTALYTLCFTFDINRPAYQSLKVKKFVANILVLVAIGLGTGYLVSVIISPILQATGMDPGLAQMIPLMGTLGLLQVVVLWLLIWGPLERRFIVQRLTALGVGRHELENGFFVGISDPASGAGKRFAGIEEDLGVLWTHDHALVYRGDVEELTIRRDQLLQLERKADHGSTSMLGGIAHVLLHVQQPDGNVRQIRFHTEGHWTMGQKRRAMDVLGNAIMDWQNRPVVPPPLPKSAG